MTRAVCAAQRAAQRQPGPSRGDPDGWAERPPTPTAVAASIGLCSVRPLTTGLERASQFPAASQ